MKLINASIKDFSEYVKKTQKKIVLFGAGAVAKTYVPYMASKYEISEYILCAVDNNISKQGSYISLFNRQICIRDITFFTSCNEEYCIWITNGEFYSVIEQLNGIEECCNTDCFVAAVMQMECERKKVLQIWKESDSPLIPRKIHYCWFSGNPIPDSLQKCIDSWSEVCPDYEIVRWDESTFDIKRYKYTLDAYKMHKWGFIPDVARLEILYENGGFYFDTDVKIIKNLDPLRFQTAFCGRERQGHVNFGGGSGCVPHSDVVRRILEFRKDVDFINPNGTINSEASGYYETWPLMEMGLKVEDISQKLEGINVYSSDFFSPYNFINGEELVKNETFSIHYFSGSWITGGDALRKQTREKYSQIKDSMEMLT